MFSNYLTTAFGISSLIFGIVKTLYTGVVDDVDLRIGLMALGLIAAKDANK